VTDRSSEATAAGTFVAALVAGLLLFLALASCPVSR
jgi:hypothetical protein